MARVTCAGFRRNPARIMDQAVESRTPVLVIRRNGKGNVVILSAEEFRGWQETVHLLSSPANALHVLRSAQAAWDGQVQEKSLAGPRPDKP